MKGIIIALLGFLSVLLASSLLLRARSWERHFIALLLAFAVGLLAYVWIYFKTPYDLYWLPAGCLEPSRIVDFLNGVLFFCLMFHFFWDFVYAFALTGFSTGILVNVALEGERGIALERLIARYLDCSGGDRIFSRRIPNLIRGGYLRQDGEVIVLTWKGRLLGIVVLAVKSLLNVREGG